MLNVSEDLIAQVEHHVLGDVRGKIALRDAEEAGDERSRHHARNEQHEHRLVAMGNRVVDDHLDAQRRREAEHGVVGDPLVASAEKGGRLFGVLVERLVALCREYHAEEPPRYREFGSHSA